jgi:hypothetical protein
MKTNTLSPYEKKVLQNYSRKIRDAKEAYVAVCPGVFVAAKDAPFVSVSDEAQEVSFSLKPLYYKTGDVAAPGIRLNIFPETQSESATFIMAGADLGTLRLEDACKVVISTGSKQTPVGDVTIVPTAKSPWDSAAGISVTLSISAEQVELFVFPLGFTSRIQRTVAPDEWSAVSWGLVVTDTVKSTEAVYPHQHGTGQQGGVLISGIKLGFGVTVESHILALNPFEIQKLELDDQDVFGLFTGIN